DDLVPGAPSRLGHGRLHHAGGGSHGDARAEPCSFSAMRAGALEPLRTTVPPILRNLEIRTPIRPGAALVRPTEDEPMGTIPVTDGRPPTEGTGLQLALAVHVCLAAVNVGL